MSSGCKCEACGKIADCGYTYCAICELDLCLPGVPTVDELEKSKCLLDRMHDETKRFDLRKVFQIMEAKQ